MSATCDQPLIHVPAITKEDLEFSVGSKQAVWEVKDPLLPVRLELRGPVPAWSSSFLKILQSNADFSMEDDSQSQFRGAGGSLVGGYGGNTMYANNTGPAAQYQQSQYGYGNGNNYGGGHY